MAVEFSEKEARMFSKSRLVTLLLLALPLGLNAQPIQVTGRVFKDGGQGLAGARVALLPAYEGYAESVRRLREGAGPAPLATALTDADGFFRIAARSGGFRVEVRADGYISMENRFVPLVEDTDLPPVLLSPAPPREVRTRGRVGRPAAGIAVEIDPATLRRPFDDEFPLLLRWQVADRSGVSGPDGRVILPYIPGEAPAVTSLSPRFLGQRATVAPGEPGIVLRLSPRPTAKIEVRDAGGRPVAEALIRWRGRPVAVTGPRGRTEIARVEGSSFKVENADGGWATVSPQPGNEVIPVRLLPRRRIAGKVLDAASRKALKGALVWAGRPPTAPAAVSDAGGAFQLDAPPGEELRVEGAAPGYLPGAQRSVPSGGAEPVLVTLTPAAEISGLVVDTAGRPLATAQVEIEAQPFEGIESVRAGADGRFRLTGLRPDGAYGLTVTLAGLAPRRTAVRTAPAGRPTPLVRIVLDRGQTASGRVADEDGRPIAGAELILVDPRLSAAVSRATSDAEGRFELRNLAAGKLDLIADHPRYTRAHLPGVAIPAGGPAVDLGTVTMADGMAIEGRVTDTRGIPIVGAVVEATPESNDLLDRMSLRWGRDGMRGTTRTGTNGGFRVERLRRGAPYSVTAARSGYAPASAPGVQAPTEEPIRIEMKVARTLSGRVVGPEGEPVAGASLTWVEESRTGFGSFSSGRTLGQTDAGGRFQVPDLLPGAVADLVVRAEGYRHRKVSGLRIPEDRDLTDVKIALERSALLEVRVLSAEGEPVAGAWVRAEPERREPGPGLGLEVGLAMEDAFVEPVPTDAGGRCRLSVEPGVYQVEASGNDGQAVQRQVVAGSASTPVELRFPPGAQVSGRVVGEDGAGLGNVSVAMSQARSTVTWTQTEADGAFRFSSVPDGSYSVMASEMQSERSSALLEVVVAGEPVRNLELRLGPGSDLATLSGRLLGLSPEEIPQAQVSVLRGADGPPMRGQVARDGSYRVDNLPPGEWRVQAYLPTGRGARETVRIEPGTRTATLDLEFPAGLTLSGRVLVDGAPLAGAEVQALSHNGENTRTSRTAYDGRFTIQGLAPGDLFLLVSGPGGIGGSRSFRMTESREMPVELSTGRLAGTVTAAGEPVEDATLEVEGWVPELKVPFSFTSAHSAAEGAFEVPRLGAGLYRITVRKGGFATTEVRIEIFAGRETAVEVRLKPAP
jgi:sarcosine oxidase gamma subunit